jgi:HAD superfamily hydrolase (TIGR01509 family)
MTNIKSSNIKVLFDWGGVLAPSDNGIASEILSKKYDIDIEAFRKYCKTNEDTYGDTNNDGGFLELASTTFNIPTSEIRDALNSAKPHQGYALAKEVAEQYPTYLVSNQIKFRTDYIKNNFDLSFFIHTYFSNEIKILKPKREFFEYVLTDIDVLAEDCVFVDDNNDNISTAWEMGFQVLHVTDVKQMREGLQDLKLL